MMAAFDAGTDDAAIAASLSTPERFTTIFSAHFDAVCAYAVRRAGPDAGAEIAAETFARAFAQRARYRPGPRGARPWLLGIATNLLRDHRRAQVRQLRAYRSDPLCDADEESTVTERRLDAVRDARIAARAVQRLSTVQRDVLLLVAWCDLTPDEVATALDMPASTVRSHLTRARARVRQELHSGNAPMGAPDG